MLSRDRDTLFPLQGALGYEITQSLFIGEHSLLVEGPSDLLYIQWFSDQLKRAKRVYLDKRWTITPCGGLGKVAGFMTLFGANRLNVAILTDYKPGDEWIAGYGPMPEIRSKTARLLNAGVTEIAVPGNGGQDT